VLLFADMHERVMATTTCI